VLVLLILAAYAVISWVAVFRWRQIRTAIAFSCAPLAPGLIAAILQVDPLAFVIITPCAYMFALPALPIYLLFRCMNWLRVWQVVSTGATLGALVAFFVECSSIEVRAGINLGKGILLFAGYGAATALVFWLIAFGAGHRSNRVLKLPIRGIE
jgi:hypothetical protein